jgi:hypothetical protein
LSRLPARARRAIEVWQLLRNLDAFSDPGALASQVRYRRDYARFERNLRHHFLMATVLRAHTLGVFDAMGGGATPETLARQCDVEVHAADAVLRILEGEGHVHRRGQRFVLSGFAEAFLTRSGSCTLTPMLDLMAAQAAAFEAIGRGMSTSEVPAPLDISRTDSDYLAYVHAVNAYLHRAGADFVARASLPPIRAIIAGSMGVSMVAHLLGRFPEASVTFGCLPHLVKEIPALCQAYGVSPDRIDGMHDHAGEPEEDPWGCQAFDLVLLTKKMILDPHHHLGERFAQKTFEVLRPGGVAVFWETIYPDERPLDRSSALEAVLNMGASPAAVVRTETGFEQLLTDMGYDAVRFVPCLFGQTTFVVARRP